LLKRFGSIPCPQCARFREKLDREKMALIIAPMRLRVQNSEEIADALIAHLTE